MPGACSYLGLMFLPCNQLFYHLKGGTRHFRFHYQQFAIACANGIALEIVYLHKTHQLVTFQRLHLIRERSFLCTNSVWSLPFLCERCKETIRSVAEWVCSP